MYIDCHCHIHDAQFSSDRLEVIARARDAGVDRIITIGTDLDESKNALSLACTYDGFFSTAGIHPNEFNELETYGNSLEVIRDQVDQLRFIATHDCVVAVGEVGLDYYERSPGEISPKKKLLQETGFVFQIALAHELKKPLVIHSRDAFDDCYRVLNQSGTFSAEGVPVVFHCYGGSLEFTRKLLECDNVYFSFAGNVTYKVRQDVRGTQDDINESVKIIPTDRILSETDSPYLAPQSVRGKRSEPAYVVEVVRHLAEIKNLTPEQMSDKIEENVYRVFPQLYHL